MIRRRFVLAALAAVAGCSGHGNLQTSIDSSSCRPASPDPASLNRARELAGEYRLLLVASSGPMSGASAGGRLTLVERDSVGVPFHGWSDIDLEAIGAHRLGDVSSRSPQAPGVLVLTTSDSSGPDAVNSVTFRFGSHANQAGLLLFDGAYTALYVRWIDRDAFGGDWASGVQGPEASGSFCAVRDGASD